MQKYPSRFGSVLLTDERKRHILQFHPDVANVFREFPATLSTPDHVTHSLHDEMAVICYRYLPKRRRFLAIVIRIGTRPFILTAYLAKKTKSGTL